MNTSIFTNSVLLKKVNQEFNVFAIQSTNYSDQNESFYRFEIINKGKIEGNIVCINGIFIDIDIKNFDGTYSKNQFLSSIAEFMNINK